MTLYVTRSARIPYVSAFFKSQVITFFYLDSERNGPPKFRLCKNRTFKATTLQSGDNRKIDLYRDYMGKKTTSA